MKRLIIDVYGEIDLDDIGTELEIDDGEVWCPETGEQYKGVFIIKSLKMTRIDSLEKEP